MERRADSREEFEDLIKRTLAILPPSDACEASTLRMVETFAVAMVETINAEKLLGKSRAETIVLMTRALGSLSFSLLCGHTTEGGPLRLVVTGLTESFRVGAKMAAHQVSGPGVGDP